jgi:hypothetical protein
MSDAGKSVDEAIVDGLRDVLAPEPGSGATETTVAPPRVWTAKERRTFAAMDAEAVRYMLRLGSLSIALMRADAAYLAYESLWRSVVESGATVDQLMGEVPKHVLRVQGTPWMRASAHNDTWLAYVVVEGWVAWGFKDPAVDALLVPAHVRALRDYRHAIFHRAPFDDEGNRAFQMLEIGKPWAADLANSIRRSLRALNANQIASVVDHLIEQHGEKRLVDFLTFRKTQPVSRAPDQTPPVSARNLPDGWKPGDSPLILDDSELWPPKDLLDRIAKQDDTLPEERGS